MVPENFYHIYNRGNNKNDIFFKRDNYIYFLEKIKKHLVPNADILAYCLMPNHFHLLVYCKDDFKREEFSTGLKILLRSYSRGINKQEGRTGSLFQQNTKIKPLMGNESDAMTQSHGITAPNSADYLTTCFHYIHQNPLKSGIVTRMENYEMSSFQDYAGFRDETLCNKEVAYSYLDIPKSSYEFLNLSYKVQLVEELSFSKKITDHTDSRVTFEGKIYRFEGLLQNDGWLCPAFVKLDDKGAVVNISEHPPAPLEEGKESISKIDGYVLPGFQNAHSHAFQYAMAGLGEIHPPDQRADNFWSWRNKMYQIALTIDPDQLEVIAAMLYSEMLRHGYTHVAEFHYLHHDKNGKSYDNLAEMGERLVSAAQRVGIKITLVPMFYQKGGFGKAPEAHQKRFISQTIDDYWQLLEESKSAVGNYDGARLGFGVHSLRAVHGEELTSTLRDGPSDLPFHIHIAEQLKEVEDCLKFSGKRPVEYLFDQVEVNDRFHLVHATHLNDNEVKMIAQSGADVVLCPTTEGNLGDGLFPFRDYKTLNGNWSIGTDSHIGLNPLEELRLLDYGQRLISHQRDTFVDESGDSGHYGFRQVLLGGRKALGNSSNQYFQVGQPFDAVVFDSKAPLLATSSPKNLLSTIIYSGDASMVLGTMTNAKWTYKRGQDQSTLVSDFQKANLVINIRG